MREYKNKKSWNKITAFKIFPFAEKEGFEPPDLLQSIVFKTIAIDHSAISPYLLRSLVFSGANIESFWLMTKLFFTIYFKTLIIKEKN